MTFGGLQRGHHRLQRAVDLSAERTWGGRGDDRGRSYQRLLLS